MTMQGPKPYFLFAGAARRALEFYQGVFGGALQLHTYAEFGRSDGPADAIAHGVLTGDVALYAADAGGDEESFGTTGLFFALLGSAGPDVLKAWFEALALGGTVLDPLQQRPWGDWDGQLRDQFGVTWLIGFEASAVAAEE
jgi:PhnB protein